MESHNKYFQFGYTGKPGGAFRLVIEPKILSRSVKKEILQAFDRRLNQHVSPGSKIIQI